DAQQTVAVAIALGPDRAAHAAAIHNAMRHPAQWHLDAVHERRRLRHPLEPCRDPSTMRLREVARLLEAAARRDGQDDFARHRIDAQGVTARLPVSPQLHKEYRALKNDLDRRRLARTAIEQRAPHGRRSIPKISGTK